MQKFELSHQNQHLVINREGGGIAEYYLENGRRQDIIYGYENVGAKTGSMGDILFPWPGRVEKCRYYFDGRHYTLSGVRVKDGHANHGFVKACLWKVTDQSNNSIALCYGITKKEYKPKGFPFDLSITVSYKLNDDGMTCTTEVTNNGTTPAPFGLGFHPYFTVDTETIDEMILNIEANKMVEFDTNLKPTGRLLKPGHQLDFNKPRKIAGTIIDNCFTDLLFENGICQTKISGNRDEQIIIWQDKNYPYLQVYSADTIGNEHRRKGLALEPQTCTGYALNLPSMGLQVLKPNAKFKGQWGIDIRNAAKI